MRRDTGESCTAYLKRVARTCIHPRYDRHVGPCRCASAEITRLKDGRTALAFQVENAVDMETGDILAVPRTEAPLRTWQQMQATVVEKAKRWRS